MRGAKGFVFVKTKTKAMMRQSQDRSQSCLALKLIEL